MSEWDEQVPAIVQSWYSGMEGGNGLADVLQRCYDDFRLPSESGVSWAGRGNEVALHEGDRELDEMLV